jgi:hypothetical protein
MNQLLTRLTAAIFIISIVGCEKSETKVFRDNQSNVKKCQVNQIIYSTCCGIKETMVFAYNSFGDPVTVTQLPRPNTGAPNYVFVYDKKRRLTEMLGLYSGGNSGLFYHKYFYANPGNSNIVVDSNYIFPVFQNGTLIQYYRASASYLTYDKAGRIIKDSTKYQDEPRPRIDNYVYDANGNLSGRSYDDHTNINQTHAIWMFVNRDYSVNNPFVADTYNSEGLPTMINLPVEGGAKFLQFFRQATISYACQ